MHPSTILSKETLALNCETYEWFYQEKIKQMRKPLGYVKIIFTNYSLYRIPQFISSA